VELGDNSCSHEASTQSTLTIRTGYPPIITAYGAHVAAHRETTGLDADECVEWPMRHHEWCAL
jgi:hypothetical protein